MDHHPVHMSGIRPRGCIKLTSMHIHFHVTNWVEIRCGKLLHAASQMVLGGAAGRLRRSAPEVGCGQTKFKVALTLVTVPSGFVRQTEPSAVASCMVAISRCE